MAGVALSVRTRRLPRRVRAGFVFGPVAIEVQVSSAQAKVIADDPELEAAIIEQAHQIACEPKEDHGATHTAPQARKRLVNACERPVSDV